MMGFWNSSGISWTICKQPALSTRQITTPTPQHSIFTGWMLFLMPNQQCQGTEGTLHYLLCYSLSLNMADIKITKSCTTNGSEVK